MNVIPYRFERSDSTSEVRERFGKLVPGSETGVTVSVAGRVMLMRPQGRLAFAQLRDSSGAVQLFATQALTERFEEFCHLSLGDWVGATGEVVTTKRGELSVKVSEWVLLAEARRGFGDKWRGISDHEVRFRQRYVDLWSNESSRRVLILRSRLIHLARRWLEDRDFMEVETPVLHPVPGGANARPFVTHHNTLDTDFYLRVAPELYLKRLLVGGFERVFEIGRVFRNEGLGPRYNPEFTMLELYSAYADYTDLMALTEELISWLVLQLRGSCEITYGGRTLDLSSPWRKASLLELVSQHTGVELDVSMSTVELRKVARSLDVPFLSNWGPGKLVFEIYEKTIEPELWGPVFVCDYPKEVSPLAREHRSRPGLAERFEVLVAGRELANAYSELTDPDAQRASFMAQQAEREAGDDEAMPVDEDYLRALDYGLPPAAGLGIGIDRLVMILADVAHIREVIAFPALRPEPGC